MSSFDLGKPDPFVPLLVLSNFSLSHSSTISFSGVVYFSSVNNCSILVCVNLSVYRTASAGGGSDKKKM